MSRARQIDLNADLGEIPGEAGELLDNALLAVITSANIACTGHAGDEQSMRRVASLAVARGVSIGAHPSYPDRAGFGRHRIDMPDRTLEASIAGQIGSLHSAAMSVGGRIAHVKPHGALYHDAMTNPRIATCVLSAARSVAPDVVLVGLAGAPALSWWSDAGARVAAEAFADRNYEPDGTLRDRSLRGAMVNSPADAAAQALALAPRARTICVHSDTPGAVAVARAVRASLTSAGWRLAPLAPGG